MDVRALLSAASGAKASARPTSLVTDREDDLEYDLGHMCAYDPSPVDEARMAADQTAYLLQCARDNAQLLTNKLHNLRFDRDSAEYTKTADQETEKYSHSFQYSTTKFRIVDSSLNKFT